MKTLIVIHPFADYQRGDKITDAAEIAQVLDGENAHHVNAVEATDERHAE